MDTKENPECFGGLCSGFDPFEAIVFLVISEAPLQAACPFGGDGCGHFLSMLFMLARSTLSFEVGSDSVLGGKPAVGVGSIYGIGTRYFHFRSCQSLSLEYRGLKSIAFVEGIKGQVLDKTDPVDLKLMYLGSKFYQFGFLAPYNRSDIRPVKAYNSIPGFLPMVEQGILLGMYFSGSSPSDVLFYRTSQFNNPIQAFQFR